MRYIKKQPEPKSFTDAKKKVDSKVGDPWLYDKILTKNVITDLRKQLSKEQNNCCAYCEAHIDWQENSNCDIDHYRKRNIFKSLDNILDYNNLFLCCKAEGRKYCADYKDDHFMDILGSKIKNKRNIEDVKNAYRFILNPTDENYKPEKYFYFLTSIGKIKVNEALDEKDKEKAELTIKLFNLNYDDLAKMRKRKIEEIKNRLKGGNKYTLDQLTNQFGFYSFLKAAFPELKSQ